MKNFIIFIILFLPFYLSAQKIDSIKVEELKLKYQTFKESLNNNVAMIDDLSETQLKDFGQNIHLQSQDLIDDFSNVFKLKKSDDYDYFSLVSLNYSIQNQPEMSSYYQVLALSSLGDDYEKNISKKIENLRELRNVSKRIYQSKNVNQLSKLKHRLLAIHQDFNK